MARKKEPAKRPVKKPAKSKTKTAAPASPPPASHTNPATAIFAKRR